jgi:hypothetical protein
MADRSEVLASAAYAALSVGGKRVLQVIEDEVRRGGGRARWTGGGGAAVARGMCRAAARHGVRQVEARGSSPSAGDRAALYPRRSGRGPSPSTASGDDCLPFLTRRPVAKC